MPYSSIRPDSGSRERTKLHINAYIIGRILDALNTFTERALFPTAGGGHRLRFVITT